MAVRTYLKAALSIFIFLAAMGGAAASPPTQATNPNPANGAVNVPVDANLSWTRGAATIQDEVYFGTDPCVLPLVTSIINLPPFPPLYNPPGDLVASTTYYWQIVEVYGPDRYEGPVWDFTTVSGEALRGFPADCAIDVPVDVNLSWIRGEGILEDEVYFGTDPCALPLVATIMNLPPFPPLYNPPGDLVASTTYYWQIVEVNGPNEYPGSVWSFSTIRGEAQCYYPEDGAMIPGEIITYLGYDYIFTELIFIPGPTAVKHTGYFSDNFDDVANRAEDANLCRGITWPAPWPWPENEFIVGLPDLPPYESLIRGQVYYWTVDAEDALGNVFGGDVWEFTILGFKAFEPAPVDGANDVDTNVLLSWLPGFGVEDHEIYMGTSREDVNNAVYHVYNQPPEFVASTEESNFMVTGLPFETKFYWRVDQSQGRVPPFFISTALYKGDVWCFTTMPRPIFVDVDAAGANNGTSWENAYNFLQDALADANSNSDVNEIRVAQGRYKPDLGAGITPSDREATFHLINGITLKGGYAGFGEANPDARDIQLYETILSGDLSGDDEPNFINNGDNSYHVVVGSGTDSTAILDGFTISGGNTKWDYPDDCGGGMLNKNGSPTVTNCTFTGNTAHYSGGGMFNWEANPTVTNCTFTGNWAFYEVLDYTGAGMFNYERSSPTLTNCTFNKNVGGGILNYWLCNPVVTNCSFTYNQADDDGAGMANYDSNPTVTNCTFSDNSSSPRDTGMFNNESNPTVSNCTFSRNAGSGMYNLSESSPTVTNCTFSKNRVGICNYWFCKPVVTNCTFSRNWTEGYSCGMSNFESSPTVINCTFTDNTANSNGGVIYNRQDSSPRVTNCIIWDNLPQQIVDHSSTSVVTYSDVQGGWPGVGNIDADPCFINAAEGNLRLSSDSPCIDTGYNYVPNLPAADMDGHPRKIDGDCNGSEVVDMGAYEFNYAYMGDFDYNCGVDFVDLSIFGLAWASQPDDFNWDFACNINIPTDNVVDRLDLAVFADNWLAGL